MKFESIKAGVLMSLRHAFNTVQVAPIEIPIENTNPMFRDQWINDEWCCNRRYKQSQNRIDHYRDRQDDQWRLLRQKRGGFNEFRHLLHRQHRHWHCVLGDHRTPVI